MATEDTEATEKSIGNQKSQIINGLSCPTVVCHSEAKPKNLRFNRQSGLATPRAANRQPPIDNRKSRRSGLSWTESIAK